MTSLSHQSRWYSHSPCLCALGDKLLELLGPLVLLYPLLPLEPDALRSQGFVSEKGWDCLVIFTPHWVWKLPVQSCDPVWPAL